VSKANHIYYVYIVASRTHVLYTGVTSEIEQRMWQQKNGAYDGFTKKFKCNRLVYFERFGSIHRAIAREKELKGWRRERKLALIEAANPTWQDLSAEWGKPIASVSWAEDMGKTQQQQQQTQPQILRAKSGRSE
jgi:putative endonuclease